jgi:hypothetical protein
MNLTHWLRLRVKSARRAQRMGACDDEELPSGSHWITSSALGFGDVRERQNAVQQRGDNRSTIHHWMPSSTSGIRRYYAFRPGSPSARG